MTPRVRDILRWSHIVASVALGVVVYSPLVDDDGALWFLRIAVVPFLVVTGVWMLVQSRRWAAGGRRDDPPR